MRTTLSSLAATIALALVLAAPAAAHVTAQPPEQAASGFAVVTLRVPNERAESTVKVEVQFPANVYSARVQPVPGWTHEIKMVKLDEPVEGSHGEEITEKVDTITWTGGEIKDGEFQDFPLSLQMPAEGELDNLVFFPATQTYDGGEVVAWTQKPSSADDDADLERPSPKVTLTAAGDEHHGGGDSDEHADEEGDDHADEESSSDSKDSNDVAGEPAFVISLAALALAVLALLFGWKRGRSK